jgi:hypothetical protein
MLLIGPPASSICTYAVNSPFHCSRYLHVLTSSTQKTPAPATTQTQITPTPHLPARRPLSKQQTPPNSSSAYAHPLPKNRASRGKHAESTCIMRTRGRDENRFRTLRRHGATRDSRRLQHRETLLLSFCARQHADWLAGGYVLHQCRVGYHTVGDDTTGGYSNGFELDGLGDRSMGYRTAMARRLWDDAVRDCAAWPNDTRLSERSEHHRATPCPYP